MGKKKRGLSGKTAALPILTSLRHRLDHVEAEYARSQSRLFATQRLLLGCIIQAGGRIELEGSLPEDKKLSIVSEEQDGKLILELRDDTKPE